MGSTPTRSTLYVNRGGITGKNPHILGHSTHEKECAVVVNQIETEVGFTCFRFMPPLNIALPAEELPFILGSSYKDILDP